MVATIEPVLLTQSDFDLLKNIEPRKSVMNFSSDELSATRSWSNRYGMELAKKSPFFRAVNGEWRDKDHSYVQIIKVERKNSTYASVKKDIRENVIYRSTPNYMPVNIDTGWKIQTSRKGIEDTIKYAFKHNDTVSLDMLYSLKALVENGVLLDSVISERNKANKAYNTAFMHRLYCICEINGDHYLTNMAIEEFADAKGGTLKRLYNLKGIKTEPLRLIGFAENQLHPAVLNGSEISIAHLFEIVKRFDKDFYLNKRKSGETLGTRGGSRPQAANEAIRAAENKAEHIPQPQDVSQNTTNADPTAIRGESRGKTMEQSAMTTKFEVSTMSKLEDDGPAKAIGTLVVNGEFAVHGVKVVDGKYGLYAAMPSERQGNGEYKDVVFPVTSEARTAIENAMLNAYEKLAASAEKNFKNDIAAPEKTVSKVYAQMHENKSDRTQTKAAGQLTIDSCLVITGVKLNEGTNKEGQTKTFVAMPSKPNKEGTYDDVAHPITADMHNVVEKAVKASANNIGRYEYKGVKYAELGENPAQSKPMHPKFADKLMAQLDKAGITYQAKCAETVVFSVKAADKQAFDAAQKALTAKLNGKDKPQQKQTTGTQTQTR